MKVIAKHPISTGDGKGGKVVIPKGSEGYIQAVSNCDKIKAAFPGLDYKPEGFYYICCFPNYLDEILCDKTQVEVLYA